MANNKVTCSCFYWGKSDLQRRKAKGHHKDCMFYENPSEQEEYNDNESAPLTIDEALKIIEIQKEEIRYLKQQIQGACYG